ncbi:PQQ-binding-like beta-propeller repeat protein [Gimesia aquarii]|uniref:Outer membrane protein assembly factor BamB n=1 Tax=Gimesia aquarii TaxID=2527964 RepID=A0A517WVR7_9PLAN|nr:PQQ-binding-like beta-propeller repeat protein [Gimesia aquarii]QDU09363.1 Outer membrane protein assembly factor BamB [Gimesia aquarii]
MNRLFPPFSGRFYLRNVNIRILLCVCILLIYPCAYLLSNDEQDGHQLIAFLDPPADKEVPDQTEPENEASNNREELIHRIYRNRSLRSQFERAEHKFRNQEITEGALQLEKLLDHQEDYFFWPEGQPRPLNFRQRTRELFSVASPRALSDYERISGPQSDWFLKQAKQNNDLTMYEYLALRFFPLQAGFEALDYLASHYLEQGNFDFSARYWDQLLNSRIHKRRMRPTHFLKAAVAYQRSGQPEKVSKILTVRGTLPVTVSGVKSNLSEAIKRVNASLEKMNLKENPGWFLSQGNPQRNRSINASLPYLNPRWSHPIARTKKSRPLDTLRNWQIKQNREDLSTAVANTPIAVDNLVIYRDFEGIRAVNIETGTTSWLFKSDGSLNSLIDRIESQTPSHSTYSQNLPLDKFYYFSSLYGSLSTNGQYVFAIDYLPNPSPQIPPQLNLGIRRRISHFPLVSQRGNRLLALPVKLTTARSIDNESVKNSSTSTQKDSLQTKPAWNIDGYYFLGAPLPVGNSIYAVAEHNSQISILCINPRNGNIHWKQGIVYVNQPIHSDRNRAHKQCPLASSQGIIVCPTQIDTLVAIDATNGDLLWNYYYGEGDHYRRISQKRYYAPVSFGHPGLTSVPVIDKNRIYYLPSGSPFIHCIDLKSGVPLWDEVPREDGEFVAAVVDQTVLIVGSDYCRGRHIEDGRELWHLHVGPVTGKGILSRNNYLLPIKSGSLLSIHIPSGKESGFTLSNATQISDILNREFKQKLRREADYAFQDTSKATRSQSKSRTQHNWYPGNIIAHQGHIISLGLWQIDSFAQAEAMLASLPQDQERSLISAKAQSNQLIKAELELSLGNLENAQRKLEALISVQSASLVKERSESLLRELLYAELNESNQNEFQILAKIEDLASTPLERGRFLSRKSKYLLEQQDYQGLMEIAEEFKKIDVEQPLAMAGDTNHLVTVKSLISGLMEKVTQKASPDAREAVDLIISNDQQIALNDGSVIALQSFLDTYGSWPQAVAVRSALADQLIQQGENQRAEFLLLENHSNPNPEIAATATRQLLELWELVGLPHEAASLLQNLNDRFANVTLDSGITGSQYVKRFNRASQVWTIFQAMQPLKHSVSHVSIKQSHIGPVPPATKVIYKNYERKFLPPPEISQLLLKAGTTLNIVNKHAGQNIGKVKISDRVSYPYQSRTSFVGHFIPLGSNRKIQGVSLLHLQDELSKPLWTAEFDNLSSSQSVFYVGPSGPRVCIFQWDNQLFGLNPATGKVLWERRNIPTKSGYLSDSSKGLIGDQKAIVAFNINRTNYDVYNSITGELIRKGELELNSRSRHAFGRKLFYQTTSTTEKRVRLWDPLSDRLLLDEPVLNSGFSTQVSANELAILLPPNRLRVLNVETGDTVVESIIPDNLLENLNKFVGFSDKKRYYFNFSYTTPRRRSPHRDFYVSDSFLNVVHVDNDLICIDKKSGSMLWSRNLPKRSWIDTSQYQLPFLIFISKIRTESKTTSYSFLFEIMDAKTGNTIGFKENIIKDTLLQMHIEPRLNKILLQGMNSAIEIDFRDFQKPLKNIFDTPL